MVRLIRSFEIAVFGHAPAAARSDGVTIRGRDCAETANRRERAYSGPAPGGRGVAWVRRAGADEGVAQGFGLPLEFGQPVAEFIELPVDHAHQPRLACSGVPARARLASMRRLQAGELLRLLGVAGDESRSAGPGPGSPSGGSCSASCFQ